MNQEAPAPPGRVRTALIGYGLAGSAFHAPHIAADDGMVLAAIVTGDPGRTAAARTRYPEAEVVADPDAIWTAVDAFDLAVLATPNRTHLPLGLAALDAGLHLVVDKPLAASPAHGRRLVEAADNAGRLLSVYQNRRWDGDFLTLRRLVADGELGEVHRFESRFERWRPVPKPGWRQEPAPEDAGGLLFDLGSHLIDQALVLFGPARLAHAEIGRRRPGARVDDDAFIALSHESGVRSHLWMNTISARPGPRFRVMGARGTWIKHGLDSQEQRLRDGRDPREPGFGMESPDLWGVLHDGTGARTTVGEAGDYAAFYAGLVASIRDGAPPPVDPWDAVRVLELIEDARTAAL